MGRRFKPCAPSATNMNSPLFYIFVFWICMFLVPVSVMFKYSKVKANMISTNERIAVITNDRDHYVKALADAQESLEVSQMSLRYMYNEDLVTDKSRPGYAETRAKHLRGKIMEYIMELDNMEPLPARDMEFNY